jgi:hypothetical protein
MEHTERLIRSPAVALLVASTLATTLLLTGCVMAPSAPPDAVNAAGQAISNAEKVGASDCAAVELGAARQHLAAAEAAVQANKTDEAQRHAERARADAEFAAAKCGLAKARAVDDEMKKSTDALKQEMQRNSNTGAAR